jgi:hypothetical protein
MGGGDRGHQGRRRRTAAGEGAGPHALGTAEGFPGPNTNGVLNEGG